MSTRASLPVEFLDAQAKCSLCGTDDWTGDWRGHCAVYVCRSCAQEVLPRLIADAVWNPMAAYRQIGYLDHVLDRIRAEFWRAVACNADRDERLTTHSIAAEIRMREKDVF